MANRQNIFNKTNGRCYYCGCQLDFDNFHMDHFNPKANGGKDKDNLVPACADCNLSKGKLSVEEFRSKIAHMLTDTHKGRIIGKYYKPTVQEIKFYFEGVDNGTL